MAYQIRRHFQARRTEVDYACTVNVRVCVSKRSDGPLGMIVLSPYGRKGYVNTIHYTHGSALRTFQEILGVTNLLGDAAAEAALDDLFSPAAAADNAAVTLTWALSLGATSYKVMRAVGREPSLTIASGLSGTTFTDRGLSSGTTYVYSVIAVNGAGERPAATPVSVKPMVVPPAPTNLTVKQIP
jgi:hypothetical protein